MEEKFTENISVEALAIRPWHQPTPFHTQI